MLDIKFVRDNPDAVKENIKKKFQDAKLPLVDEVIEKDAKYRECLKEVESLKAARNKLSKANGPLFGQLKKCTDEAKKAELQAQIDANNAAVKADADKMAELEAEEGKLVRPHPGDHVHHPPDDRPQRAHRSRMTAITSRHSASASLSCPISPSRITPRSWRALTALIWTLQAAWLAMASIICWATSPACTRLCWLTPAIL